MSTNIAADNNNSLTDTSISNTLLNSTQTPAANILVTGATGLVGSHLIKELVGQGRKVKALYRTSVPVLPNENLVEWVQADILDVVFLDQIMRNIDEVYHCAAIVSFDINAKDEMYNTNVNGTANVVNACLTNGVKKLCYVSSVAAIGREQNKEVNETLDWTDSSSNSNYSRTKYISEMEVWRGVGEGLNSVIINPSIILGFADWSKGSAGIFKTAYDEFPWYTEGVTGFVDVKDVVRAMVELMDKNIFNERFILSEGNHKYKDVFSMIARAFGKKPPYKKVSSFMASLVWRMEAVRSLFTHKKPLLTKETARSAQALVNFNNSKLTQYLPTFKYTPLHKSIDRICNEFKSIYKL